MSERAAMDREALLAALVLAPATWSRNRFFDLYKDPALRRVHRRAAALRAMVRHLGRPSAAEPVERVALAPRADGGGELAYEVPAIGLRRTATLDPLELALLRFALAQPEGSASPLALAAGDRRRIEAVLARLAPPLGPAAPRDPALP